MYKTITSSLFIALVTLGTLCGPCVPTASAENQQTTDEAVLAQVCPSSWDYNSSGCRLILRQYFDKLRSENSNSQQVVQGYRVPDYSILYIGANGVTAMPFYGTAEQCKKSTKDAESTFSALSCVATHP